MQKILVGSGVLAGLIVLSTFGISQTAIGGGQETALLMTVNQDLMREALKPLGLNWTEVEDDDGLTSFHLKDGEVTRFVIYQYRASNETPVDSIGISAGYDLAIRLDPRQMNSWNSTTRFSKAYVDSDGDPFLTADMMIKPGVSLGSVTEFVRGFQKSQTEFESVVLNRKSN